MNENRHCFRRKQIFLDNFRHQKYLPETLLNVIPTNDFSRVGRDFLAFVDETFNENLEKTGRETFQKAQLFFWEHICSETFRCQNSYQIEKAMDTPLTGFILPLICV